MFKSSLYFDLKRELKDTKNEYVWGNAGDKAIATSKLVGKGIANLGVFTAKLGWVVIKSLPAEMEKAVARQNSKK